MGKMKSLKIAIIGSKGLPAVYGGIERHVEEIGKRLARKGHEITVFGRKPFCKSREYLGMRIEVLPSISTKNLDTATNSLIACFKTLLRPFDIVHFHGIGPSILAWIPSMSGKKTVSTIHALDYRQQKWGSVAKRFLKAGEKTAVKQTSAAIAVSRLMSIQLSGRYGREVVYIPNGATIYEKPEFKDSSGLGLESGRYILSVGRFIVERGFHTLIEAFAGTDTNMRLVIVGDERFEREYAGKLHRMADERVLFPGYISGDALNELYSHCAFYVLPSLVEGLPISLMEAMSFSRPVLVSDIPENLEVAEGIAVSFVRGNAGDLARSLRKMIDLDDSRRETMGTLGKEKVMNEYNWDSITNDIERLYLNVISC